MRKQSFRWSEWARQGSNLRPLGDQPTVYSGCSNPTDLGTSGSDRLPQVHVSTPKPDDKPTVDHGSPRPLGQRLTDRYKVTGFTYTGTPAVTAEVTGYPIYRGYTGPDITVVSLLTDDGEIVDNVRVSTEVMDTVKVHNLGGMSEDALWKIADRDLFWRGGHALAELARRERERVAAQRAKDAAWTAKMRADGDRLLAGAR